MRAARVKAKEETKKTAQVTIKEEVGGTIEPPPPWPECGLTSHRTFHVAKRSPSASRLLPMAALPMATLLPVADAAWPGEAL